MIGKISRTELILRVSLLVIFFLFFIKKPVLPEIKAIISIQLIVT